MFMKRLSGAAAAVGLFAAFLSPAPADEPDGFDFYVLSLSWSPSYCAAEGEEANRQQCGSERPYAFVVHGLWPQFERGYPEFCPNRAPDRVPETLVARMLDMMPSAGLIGHQWRKHGSCAGLGQQAYFEEVRKARGQITVPPAFQQLAEPLTVDPQQVENAFLEANPGLPAEGVAVTCGRRYLREVRICLTRDLAFRPCHEVDRKDCRRQKVLMPPSRGR